MRINESVKGFNKISIVLPSMTPPNINDKIGGGREFYLFLKKEKISFTLLRENDPQQHGSDIYMFTGTIQSLIKLMEDQYGLDEKSIVYEFKHSDL